MAAAKTPDEIITNSIGMKFASIPLGEFQMGSPDGEAERRNNETQHKVTLTRGFLIGATTITQAQWKTVMGTDPSHFKGDALPVESVTWNDAVDFCKKLGAMEGKTYRLPTEAEWEYACRAGSTTPFNTGQTISTRQANYNGDFVYGNGEKGEYRATTTPVGTFPANAWKLHDMHGNVWQWCSDVHADYPQGDATDPTGPKQNANAPRVLRGGSWYNDPGYCRSAIRIWHAPGIRNGYIGFRVVLDSR